MKERSALNFSSEDGTGEHKKLKDLPVLRVKADCAFAVQFSSEKKSMNPDCSEYFEVELACTDTYFIPLEIL